MERNALIDRMRGVGILLMVLGHSGIPQPFYGAIFTFHMPLFFLLSGYLYKERPLQEVVKRNWQKILKPYLWCLIFVTPVCLYHYGKDWLLTALFTKNVPSICGFNWNGYIGPMWFLLAFFVATVIMSSVRRISLKWLEVTLLLFLFECAWFILKKTGSIFPFQIFQSLGGVLFMYIGYVGRVLIQGKMNTIAMIVICLLTYIPIVKFGSLSMASFEYRLNVLQLLGGVSGTILLYYAVRRIRLKWLEWCGRMSMPILCFHSIDYHYRGGKVASLLCDNSLPFYFVIEFIMHVLVIVALWLVVSRITYFRKVFSIDNQTRATEKAL